MFTGLGDEIIKVLNYIVNSEDWFFFLFFFGGTVFAFIRYGVDAICKLVRAFIPKIERHYHCTTNFHYKIDHCEHLTAGEAESLVATDGVPCIDEFHIAPKDG